MKDYRLHKNGINHKHAADGRSRKALAKIDMWQAQLDSGLTVAEIVETSILHRKDKPQARLQYKERLQDLLDTGVLKCEVCHPTNWQSVI